jgi:hypothetical protein
VQADWSKPLIDRTLIGVSHDIVFEKSTTDVVAVKAEAGPPLQQHVVSLHQLGLSLQERAVRQFKHTGEMGHPGCSVCHCSWPNQPGCQLWSSLVSLRGLLGCLLLLSWPVVLILVEMVEHVGAVDDRNTKGVFRVVSNVNDPAEATILGSHCNNYCFLRSVHHSNLY